MNKRLILALSLSAAALAALSFWSSRLSRAANEQRLQEIMAFLEGSPSFDSPGTYDRPAHVDGEPDTVPGDDATAALERAWDLARAEPGPGWMGSAWSDGSRWIESSVKIEAQRELLASKGAFLAAMDAAARATKLTVPHPDERPKFEKTPMALAWMATIEHVAMLVAWHDGDRDAFVTHACTTLGFAADLALLRRFGRPDTASTAMIETMSLLSVDRLRELPDEQLARLARCLRRIDSIYPTPADQLRAFLGDTMATFDGTSAQTRLVGATIRWTDPQRVIQFGNDIMHVVDELATTQDGRQVPGIIRYRPGLSSLGMTFRIEQRLSVITDIRVYRIILAWLLAEELPQVLDARTGEPIRTEPHDAMLRISTAGPDGSERVLEVPRR